MLALSLKTDRSNEAMWPRICHILAGENKRERKLSATSQNLIIQENVG